MAIPTLAMIPSGYKAGKLYSVLPSDGTGDFTVARNSVATRVNQSGLIEEVGVNVPRLDYSAGGCPVLLTEIQSQNKITYSEDFSNSSWLKTRALISSNVAISPDGTLNADKLIENTESTTHSTQHNATIGNVNTTISVFVKADTRSRVRIILTDLTTGDYRIDLNLNNSSVIENNGGSRGSWTNTSYKIENFTNNWYKVSLAATKGAGSQASLSINLLDNSGNHSYTGDGTSGFYIWGAQLEAQPAVTSYIKTTGTIQTREADLVNGAGSAATFNSLEHTFFVDLNSLFQSGTTSSISIVGSTGTVSSNRIMILKQANNTDVTFQIKSGGATAATETLSNIDSSVRQKLVITVKLNEVKYYRNGFLFATDTGTIPLPVSLGEITLTSGTTGSPLAASTKDIRYYNQVLTEAETLELMSYDSFNEMASALQYTIK